MVGGYSNISGTSKCKERHRNGPSKEERKWIWAALEEAFNQTDYTISKFMPGLAIYVNTGTVNPFPYFGKIDDTYILTLVNIDIYGCGWRGGVVEFEKIASVADPKLTGKVINHVLSAHRKLLSDRVSKHSGYVDVISKVMQKIDTKLGQPPSQK